MNEAVNTWNEKHPGQLLVLNRFGDRYSLTLYDEDENGEHEKQFTVSADSFRKAWDNFIEITE